MGSEANCQWRGQNNVTKRHLVKTDWNGIWVFVLNRFQHAAWRENCVYQMLSSEMELEDRAVKIKLNRNPRSVFPNTSPVHGPPLWDQSPCLLVKAAAALALLMAVESPLGRVWVFLTDSPRWVWSAWRDLGITGRPQAKQITNQQTKTKQMIYLGEENYEQKQKNETAGLPPFAPKPIK